jgi:hypothetical protein
MFLAFIGALTAQLLLSHLHNGQLERLVVTTMTTTERDS